MSTDDATNVTADAADVIVDVVGATPPEIETAFEVRGPVVVAFTSDDADEGEKHPTCQYLDTDPANKQILLETHLHQSSSFFKLRIPVRLKRLDKTFLYFHLPSHHISSLDWATDIAADDATNLRLFQSKLNSGGSSGVTRLDFRLHTPGQLIVPAAQDSLEPKNPATAHIVDSLTSLATALSFSFYVPHTVFSKARLQLLETTICDPVSSTLPQSLAHLQDLRSLYNGKGGKQWKPEEIDDGTASTASDSAASTVAVDTPPGYGPPPPRYDEIARPESPEEKRQGKRPRSRVSSGSPSARPSKRGAWGEDAIYGDEKRELPTASNEALFAQMEVLVRAQHQYIQQQQTHILQQQEHIKQQDAEMKRLVATTADLERQVADMQEQLDEAGSKVENVDVGLLELGEDLDEVKRSIPDCDEIAEDLGSQIEQEVREQLERRLHDVFNRIGNAIMDG
ncbi:hypothetical protein PG985_003449 [Apiospora marii]|uniref:uncharacterized protein n=1 Tax=Apiospora marii TaxID=335849 RepID=UPI00312D5FE8